MNTNVAILAGVLVGEVEFKQVKDTYVAKFMIETRHTFKRSSGDMGEEVNEVDVEAFGKVSEEMRDARDGDSVAIEGKVKTGKWPDKRDATKTNRKQFISAHRIQVEAAHKVTGSSQVQAPVAEDDIPY